MNAVGISNLVLWGVQGFLALLFLFAGIPKLLGRGLERWTGFAELPRAEVVFIGLTEVLGAAALVLPMATGMLTWLTPLAALGLALIVLMATGFHLRGSEYLNAIETALWASISVVVAIGRWDLVATRLSVPAWVIVGALAVLVPAAIINVIILLKRPVTRAVKQPVRSIAA
ncbi:MAG TPA: DoxX family protein [Gemmatimonadaceae bacterium]|nr:DoxX family protein [Gemmatimonadaceae bacterium]